MKLRVAGVQMPVLLDVEANKKNILDAIRIAADEGADILLTPEGSLSGYTHFFDAHSVEDALDEILAFARPNAVGLALGTCFLEDDRQIYNQIRFYRPDGLYLGFHSKTLTCGSLKPPVTGEINHYAVSDLRVFRWREDLTIAGLICNDLWANPEVTPAPDVHLSQQLADMGTQVLFHAVNGGRDGSEWSQLVWHYHEANLRMRARAGGLWMVTVDNCFPISLPCSAPSGIITPTGDWACRTAPSGPQFFTYTIDVNGEGQ